MKQLKGFFKNQKTYIILLLIITGIFFYLRSVNRELIFCDEIIYGYNLNASEYYEYWASPETSLDGKVNTISDIVDSQINHYFYGNGRSIVHGIQQFFTGVLSIDVFYIVNTLVFLLMLVCVVKLLNDSNIYIYIYAVCCAGIHVSIPDALSSLVFNKYEL